jgi:hypothetical protein
MTVPVSSLVVGPLFGSGIHTCLAAWAWDCHMEALIDEPSENPMYYNICEVCILMSSNLSKSHSLQLPTQIINSQRQDYHLSPLFSPSSSSELLLPVPSEPLLARSPITDPLPIDQELLLLADRQALHNWRRRIDEQLINPNVEDMFMLTSNTSETGARAFLRHALHLFNPDDSLDTGDDNITRFNIPALMATHRIFHMYITHPILSTIE